MAATLNEKSQTRRARIVEANQLAAASYERELSYAEKVRYYVLTGTSEQEARRRARYGRWVE